MQDRENCHGLPLPVVAAQQLFPSHDRSEWNTQITSRRTFVAGLLAAASPLYAQSDEPAWLTIEQASPLLRRKKLSPVELAKSCLGRIEKLNTSLNAFITITAEQALAQAREAEKELLAGRSRGPLHGIPVALKDLIDTAGVPTTCASKHYDSRVPAVDAPVVRILKNAGAVLLGKLNMDEFAYNFTSETSSFGRILNPWDTKRSPGGSSGGSAVAVAAGMCLGALGSDTGGSIRLPAALCGIAGLKPSYGKIPTEGVAPLAWSLDHLGPMCRSVRDTALMLGVLAGSPVADVRSTKGVRLGVPLAPFFHKLDSEVDKTIAAALETLSSLTAGTREVVMPRIELAPELPGFPLAYARIIAAEAYAFHEPMLKSHPERYNPRTRKNVEGGAAVTTAAYIRARQEMEQLRASSSSLFEKADVLVTPAAPGPAFPFGTSDLVFLRNAAWWNLFGLPAISIPCGFTSEGLPVGLQITGPTGREDLVLAVAGAYQQATSWHSKRPPRA